MGLPQGRNEVGEVYRAKDTRLDRTVAIKVLPSHLSNDTGLRERFGREAKAVSQLNHPHICTLHDIGHQAGIDYLVMEYLEGETLAARGDVTVFHQSVFWKRHVRGLRRINST